MTWFTLAADGDGFRKVIGCSTAGIESLTKLTSGHCMRISTGAPVPDGADAVVQVEDTELVEQKVKDDMKSPCLFQ